METSQYESDEDGHLNDRIEKIREAEARENLRIKSAALKRKMAARVGSPLCTSKKTQPSSSQVVSASVEPTSKKSKPTKTSTRPVIAPLCGIAQIDDVDKISVLCSSFEAEEDVLRLSSNNSIREEVPDKPTRGTHDQRTFTIPRKDKTSAILPERFWPSDMSALQVDKLSVDQVHALKKLELEEKSLKKENDLPGLVIKPTELYLPEVVVEGGTHDFVKKIVPGSMLHFPIGSPDDWWENVPTEWKTVTGKFNCKIYNHVLNVTLVFRRVWPRGEGRQ